MKGEEEVKGPKAKRESKAKGKSGLDDAKKLEK